MSSVIRLPAQHREKPHCVDCGEPIPWLADGLQISVHEALVLRTVTVTLKITCVVCRAPLEIETSWSPS